MNREKWNEICFILSENIHKEISEDLFEKYMIQALRVLGWKQYLNELDIRPSFQIGASNRIAPDIIIQKQDQERLFVIELKQPHLPLNLNFQKQLFSYMRQLRLEYGLLIGKEIKIFYDGDIMTHDNPVLLETITFDRDSVKGENFVNLFGKENFNKDKLDDYVLEFKKEQEKKEQSILLRDELFSDNFNRQAIEAIKSSLSEKYNSDVIESVFENINVHITDDILVPREPITERFHSADKGQLINEHIFTSLNKSVEDFLFELTEKYINDEVEKNTFWGSGVWLKVRLNYIAGLILTNRGKDVFSPKDIRNILCELVPTLKEVDDGKLSGWLLSHDVCTAAKIKYNNGYPCFENVGRGHYRFVGFKQITAKQNMRRFQNDTDDYIHSNVVDSASFSMNGQNYILKRFQNSSIRIFDANDRSYNIAVKPILRKIIDDYNLNIPLYFDSGTLKNTRTLGKEVIQFLNNKSDAQIIEDEKQKS